jgi:hypothetical protein
MLKVFSQLPFAEKGGRLDDCGPAALASAIFYSSKELLNPGVKAVIDAAAKAGRVDKNGTSEGTTFVQIVKAAELLGAKMTVAPSWAKAVAAMKAGNAVCVAFRAPVAAPKSTWSAAQKASLKRRPKNSYAHSATMAIVDGKFVFADPMMSGKGPEEFGKVITEAEAKTLAHWGIGEANAKRKTPMAWIVTVKASAIKPQPVVPVVATLSPTPTINVEAPRKTVEARKVESGTKTPSELDKAIKSLENFDWESVGKQYAGVAAAAIKGSSKETTVLKKIKFFLTYVAVNTKLDEMLLDAARTFLTVSISVALGLGIPLLDINGGDFRLVVSAGLASALQVVVKALDPSNSDYGIVKK